VNGTIQPNCADVPIRNYSLHLCDILPAEVSEAKCLLRSINMSLFCAVQDTIKLLPLIFFILHTVLCLHMQGELHCVNNAE